MRRKLIIPSTEHKAIDGLLLVVERERTGLSQAEFAAACNHSQQYQQKLEAIGRHEITSAKAQQILAVLEKYNQSVV